MFFLIVSFAMCVVFSVGIFAGYILGRSGNKPASVHGMARDRTRPAGIGKQNVIIGSLPMGYDPAKRDALVLDRSLTRPIVNTGNEGA